MGDRVGILARLRNRMAPIGDRADSWLDALRSSPARLGKRGEEIAARHLKRRGYRIVARNFRAAGAEIDLIAIDHGTVVFVEVKARETLSAGAPAEAVDERKQERIRRAAQVYMSKNRLANHAIRFDVVAISGAGRNRRLELFKDAF